ncbi:MAG: NADH:ubiquinone reductase (Na(+)-transporting) subunit F [Deltaproteobacteria bacterium]|nr:NADH:ubiquinone reductase (Na(+)-transporting) subunit F [Deltaproteobacteria bacterium]
MIFLVSLTVFLAVIMTLVGILLLVEAKVVLKGDREIVVNDDADKTLKVPSGTTLLSALVGNEILLPSACGGSGTCGMCRCKVESGGRDILPTELAHLSRSERLGKIRLACQLKVREDMRIRIPDEIFNITKYNATVVSNDNVASFIKELVLALDPGQHIDYRSGAYVQIDVPAYSAAFSEFNVIDPYRDAWDMFGFWDLKARTENPIFRAYSMASSPSESLLRFTIRIATPPPGAGPGVLPGVGSSYVFNLKPGQKVVLSGPYGDFFIKETQHEMCFVGGGAGMAPMRSHIFQQLKTEGTFRKMTFWYGARSKKEMFYDEEFVELVRQFDNFSYHVALSEPQPEDNWTGMTGFIHQCLLDGYLSAHEDPTEIEYYLCGPPLMIDAVKKMLDDLGVDPEMIAYDDFG